MKDTFEAAIKKKLDAARDAARIEEHTHEYESESDLEQIDEGKI